MTAPFDPIERVWQSYHKHELGSLPQEMVDACYHAFYAGVWAVYGVAEHLTMTSKPETVLAFFAECEQAVHRYRQRPDARS